MSLQRLGWPLPALIVSWLALQQLAAALPAHGERLHVFAQLDPSAANSSAIIREGYDKVRGHPDGKNGTQPGVHKLVASPAGLLRPDKFQFYTYNDKGDMITRQMTVQEIQGLIAAGGADHVAMDRQEPQKADDVLTGGKKVMDVVQKVQNVLKSALDKPPTLTGSIPKIPEHANVEWSNILPSILSGETDTISPSSESVLHHELTMEKLESGSGVVSTTASSSDIGTRHTTLRHPTRKPDIQTNAYAGFTNNMQHVAEKPQHAHHSQQPMTGGVSEKPMIPVPVITLMEQKLSTLRPAITESPVFEMLSVIPVVEATEEDSSHKRKDQITESSVIDNDNAAGPVRVPPETEVSKQDEKFVELTLSEVPEGTTASQTNGVESQTIANPGNKTGSQVSPIQHYSTLSGTTSESSSSTVVTDTVTSCNRPDKVTSVADKTNATYILVPSKNNTGGSSEDALSSMSDVTKESQANGTRNDDEVIPENDAATSTPLSHGSLGPMEATEIASSSASLASASRIEVTTGSNLLHTDREDPSITKDSLSSVTVTGNHLNSQSTGSLIPMEPLPTQLIDSLSSVMSQVSEVRPPVLSLSSTSDGAPQIPIMNINYGEGHNDNMSDSDGIGTNVNNAETQQDQHAFSSHDENITERIVSLETYATNTTVIPQSQGIATRIVGSPTPTTTQRSTMAVDRNVTNAGISNLISANSQPAVTTSATVASTATINRIVDNRNVTTPAGSSVASSVDTTILESTTRSSFVSVQLEKTENASSEKDRTETPAILEIAADAASEKRVTDDKITPVKVPVALSTKATDTESSTSTNGYLENTLTNLNWSNPMSAIDQVLNVASLPSGASSIEPIALPNDTSKLTASVLASSLIAGFTSSTSEKSPLEDISDNQIIKNAPAQSARPTILSNVTKLAGLTSVTQTYEKNAESVTNEEKGTYIAQASTQKTIVTDGTGIDVLKLIRTKESNNASIKEKNDSEKTDNSAIDSLSSSENASVEAVATNSEQLSTNDTRMTNDTQSNVNKTLDTISNQNGDEDKEKIKATESSVVSSELPVKIQSIDSINANDVKNSSVDISDHAGNGSKVETKLDKNNGSTTDDSSATKGVIEVHSANESNSELKSHKNDSNDVTKDSVASNATQRLPDGISAQNSNRPNDTESYWDKDADASTLTHIAAIGNRTVLSNEHNNNESTAASSLPVQEVAINGPLIGNVTRTVSPVYDTSGNKEQLSRPINGTDDRNSGNDTSNANNDDTLSQQAIISMDDASMSSESSVRNASMRIPNQPNSTTDGKPASLKHSGTASQPEVTRLQLSTVPPTAVPFRRTTKPATGHGEPDDASKTDADSNKWTLISQQVPAGMKIPKPTKTPKPSRKPISPIVQTPSPNAENANNNVRTPIGEETHQQQQQDESSAPPVLPLVTLDASQGANGLDATTRYTSADIVNFAKLCNELALNFWVATNKGLSTARSLALSPFGMTSLLAMIFLGARGPTSDQMNEVLRLDDVATFNPHLVFQNITDAVSLARGQGIANAAFVRELFADKMKVRKLMPFYKEQAQQFYEGLVTEVNFATISDLVRRRTNLLVRKQTGGRIKDFVKTNTVPLRSPLAALSANVFQTDCNSTLTSSIGRDGELYFAVSPAVRQRKLVPVPATTWRSGVLAGYEPSIDATAVALGGTDKLVSTIFVLPGQQGHAAPGDTLDRLEQRLVRSAFRDGAWNKLLKVLIPRSGLELQVPKFSHRSVVNATAALKRMGLDELFSGNADFKGINGIGHRLHLADVLQMNLFSTCGDENILGGRHHVETYPASPLRRNVRRQMDNTGNLSEDDDAVSRYSGVSSSRREDRVNSFYADQLHTARAEIGFYREERQLGRSSAERPRLKLDRPFLYYVRHNPSGIILHMGRFNPRLLP